jgi:hypothetical protein
MMNAGYKVLYVGHATRYIFRRKIFTFTWRSIILILYFVDIILSCLGSALYCLDRHHHSDENIKKEENRCESV